MTQCSAPEYDYLSREPLLFRNIPFWENPLTEDFEVYTNPLSGWWYRIRRATESDAHVPASGYLLEAWSYGDPLPAYLLTEDPLLESASLAELIACVAVLATEQTSPKLFFEGVAQERDRILARWTLWLNSAPAWVKALCIEPRFT